MLEVRAPLREVLRLRDAPALRVPDDRLDLEDPAFAPFLAVFVCAICPSSSTSVSEVSYPSQIRVFGGQDSSYELKKPCLS